jgi:class 3 adenylate cyclase
MAARPAAAIGASGMDPQTQITQLLIRRRRAAILAADVAGYSRLMGANEEQTLKRLDAARTIMDSRIRQHGGRIANTAGDSVIAEFASAVAAVRCAVEVQTALGQRNAALPPADRLQFRIGINYGEVMANRADLLGDNVNVAARIENLAQPGGILVSESVHEQVFGRAAVAFRPLGPQALKNIDRKIVVFEVMHGAAPAAPPTARPSPAVPRAAAPADRTPPSRARPAPEPPGSRAWPLVVALGLVVLLALGAIAYLVTTELLPRAPAPAEAPAAPSPDAADSPPGAAATLP